VTSPDSLRAVQAYMPDNYGAVEVNNDFGTSEILIVGYDVSGWSLDAYVIPRLACGLIWAKELK